MPLKKRCSIKAMQDNIRELIRKGYDRSQAVAIAYDTLRRACLSPAMAERAKKEKWTPKEIVGEEYNIIDVLNELKKEIGIISEQELVDEPEEICLTEPLLDVAVLADEIKKIANDAAMRCDAGMDISRLQKRLGELIIDIILAADMARIDLSKLQRILREI